MAPSGIVDGVECGVFSGSFDRSRGCASLAIVVVSASNSASSRGPMANMPFVFSAERRAAVLLVLLGSCDCDGDADPVFEVRGVCFIS